MSDSHTPSPDEVAATRTLAGGWTKVTLAAWGVYLALVVVERRRALAKERQKAAK